MSNASSAPGPACRIAFRPEVTLAFQCRDRARSMAWYESMLGFQRLYDVPEIGWCEVGSHIPGVSLGFSEVESPKVGGTVPTFGVLDIDAARKELEAKGVRFDGQTRTIPGMVKLATLFDPDGNALMLVQSLQ
ncbi:MAG: VOC family protein [Phycisphaerales bacterium]|nr:VOC family protein [Phycisphaerales bacterium]